MPRPDLRLLQRSSTSAVPFASNFMRLRHHQGCCGSAGLSVCQCHDPAVCLGTLGWSSSHSAAKTIFILLALVYVQGRDNYPLAHESTSTLPLTRTKARKGKVCHWELLFTEEHCRVCTLIDRSNHGKCKGNTHDIWLVPVVSNPLPRNHVYGPCNMATE